MKDFRKHVLSEAIHEMIHDVNIVRLTFLTTFFHSLIVTLVLILNTNKLIVHHYENGLYIGKVAEFLIQEINRNHVLTVVLIVAIVLFVLYSLIYPLGQGALIHYLQHRKGILHSLKAVFPHFFPMFEFGFISLIFSPIVFFITAYRVFLETSQLSGWMIFWFVVWFALMTLGNTLKIYTRYFIVLHNLALWDALKASYLFVVRDFVTTRQYMRLQTIFLINFSLNLILIIGIPLGLMAAAIWFGVIDIWFVKTLVYIIFFFLVIFGAYLSSFIRAFFAYYWWKLFHL